LRDSKRISWTDAGEMGVSNGDVNQIQNASVDAEKDDVLFGTVGPPMTRQDLISLSYEEYKPPRAYKKPPEKIKSRSSSVVIVVSYYNSNDNLTFILRIKHAMQTQRRRSFHIGKTHDQHLEACYRGIYSC